MAKRGPGSAKGGAAAGGTGRLNCAIYTRKSTEEGLDQEFNSLDAQREACAAYILSQRHEGWTLVPGLYDDGGFSGGTMERPGLKRLLADVEAGRMDIIVVYKVDRLTRALSDFAKIVEILDAKGASFVSVTQDFNTTTSMGRLTLNVLLSFAQFEREVTGERIRDKIAASKKKGMWMGGPVPLGYDVVSRKLIINEAEAQTVRLIFERHQALGSIRELAADLAVRGICSKLRTMRDGRVVGGMPYGEGALGHLLRNVLYTGHVRHGDQVYPGEHQAILDQAIWDASQALLASNMPRPHSGHMNLLSGMLIDSLSRPMVAQHANKGGRRYRYYVSRITEGQADQPWRIPAGDLEVIVTRRMTELFADPVRIAAELGYTAASPLLIESAARIANRIDEAAALRSVLQQLDAAISISQDSIEIALSADALADMVRGGTGTADDHRIRLMVPATLKRRGHELRLVYAVPDARPAERDDRLIQLIANGRVAFETLISGRGGDPGTRRQLTRLARLHFLAPDIVTTILDGRQPVEVTSRALLRISDLPLAWDQQRIALGFA